MENNCQSCQKISEGKANVKSYQYWVLEHVAEPVPVKGWMILRLKRHGEGLESLNAEESKELGEVLSGLPKAIQEITKAKTVYLCSFNESVPHLHFHFIPRYVQETRRTIEFFTLQNEVKSGKVPAVDSKEVDEFVNNLKDLLK